MKRTDLMDTSEWAHREMVRRLREMTPSQRVQIAVELSQQGVEIHKLALQRIEAKRKAKSGA